MSDVVELGAQLDPFYNHAHDIDGYPLEAFDTQLSFSFDVTAEIPSTGQLCLMPQGTAAGERIGSRIFIRRILLQLAVHLIPNSYATMASTPYFYLVLDRQCNGAAATVADATTGVFVGVSNSLGRLMPNLVNSSRFIILMAWNPRLQGVVAAGYGSDKDTFTWDSGDVTIPITWDSSVSTGALTSIRTNNLFIIAGSDETTDDRVSLYGVCRLLYREEDSM